MSFPLLRLPLLASINVIKNISVTQIINLIQTSSKVQQLVKISNYPVQLHVCPKSITLKHPMNPEELRVLIVVRSDSEEDQAQIRFQQNQDQVVFTEWNDKMEGYRRIIDFLVEYFTVECISFEQMHYDYQGYEIFLEYLEYSKSRGIKFDKVRVWNGSWKEGMNERMLSACSDASELDLALNCARNFTFNGFHEFKMNSFDVYLSFGGEWFTVDYMCALINCSKVKVHNLGYWKAKDFNKFLKFWIKSSGRLRAVNMVAWGSGLNLESLMDGITYEELRLQRSFRIQRDNGMKASVQFSRDLFSLRAIDS